MWLRIIDQLVTSKNLLIFLATPPRPVGLRSCGVITSPLTTSECAPNGINHPEYKDNIKNIQ